MTNHSDQHTATSPGLLSIALLAAMLLLFFVVNPQVIADWRVYSFDDGNYSHAYLMVVVIAWLFGRAWYQRQLQLRWHPAWLLALVAGLLCYLWLTVAQQAFFSRLALPLVLALVLLPLFRPNLSLLVPVALVWFITPIWNVLNGVLQNISVIAVNRIMSSSSVPTLVEGNLIHIPAGTFEVAGGCSGLRYLVTALALAVIYSFLSLRRPRSIVIFFMVAIGGALVTNWLRIAALVYIGHATEMQSSLIADHNMFGWYLFVPFVVVLFFIGNRLEPLPAPPQPLPPLAQPMGRSIAVLVLVVALFSGVSIHVLQSGELRWVAPVFDVESEPAGTDRLDQPTPVVYAWTTRYADSGLQNMFLLRREQYSFDGTTDAHKADFYLNSPVPRGWARRGAGQGPDYAWLELISSQGERAMVAHAYRIGEYQTGDPGAFSTYRLREALRLNQQTEWLWAMVICPGGDCAGAERALREGLVWRPAN